METQVLNHKHTSSILLDEDLLDHIYDPPLWSAGPYLKMVDDDVRYSPVSDPLLRARISVDDVDSDKVNEKECRITVSETNEQISSPKRTGKLSRKTIQIVSSFLTISVLFLTFMVFL